MGWLHRRDRSALHVVTEALYLPRFRGYAHAVFLVFRGFGTYAAIAAVERSAAQTVLELRTSVVLLR